MVLSSNDWEEERTIEGTEIQRVELLAREEKLVVLMNSQLFWVDLKDENDDSLH